MLILLAPKGKPLTLAFIGLLVVVLAVTSGCQSAEFSTTTKSPAKHRHANSTISTTSTSTSTSTSKPTTKKGRDEDDDNNDENDDEKKKDDDDDDVVAGSRARGGTPVDPPHYLQNMWYNGRSNNPLPRHYETDGHFAGHAIRLSDHTFLSHTDSCNHVEASNLGASHGDSVFQWKQSAEITPHEPNPDGPGQKKFGCAHHERLGRTGFAIHKYHDQAVGANKNPDPLNIMELRNEKKLKEKPQLQSDPNVKDNCHLHAYSQGHTKSADHRGERTFSRIPVEHAGCQGDMCNFNIGSNRHKVCGHLSDVGAPIMCGGGDKISHVVAPDDSDRKDDCRNNFQAMHVAPHHKKITDTVRNYEHQAGQD